MSGQILIADDNADYRKLLTDTLQAAGYDILVVQDGKSAIELARSAKPSLILMDVEMPVLDGLSAVKMLKADPDTRPIPVIAITAMAMSGDRERILASGFDGYMSKPISIKRLRSVVSAQLDRGRGEDRERRKDALDE